MVILDRVNDKKKAASEKKQEEEKEANPEEEFKFKDILSFKLPFWLLTISCVVTYMSIFPYIQKVSDLVKNRNNIDSESGGTLFGIPYLISAIASPVLGKVIDGVGKRALFITLSSALLIVAFLISLNLPGTDQSKLECIPLVLVGIAYSVYCAAIWGSIPYTVTPQTVGTAFGICTAIQNIGLVIAPTIVSYLEEHTTRGYNFFWILVFFIGVNVIGLICNGYLYYIDLKYYDGILDRVDTGEAI